MGAYATALADAGRSALAASPFVVERVADTAGQVVLGERLLNEADAIVQHAYTIVGGTRNIHPPRPACVAGGDSVTRILPVPTARFPQHANWVRMCKDALRSFEQHDAEQFGVALTLT